MLCFRLMLAPVSSFVSNDDNFNAFLFQGQMTGTCVNDTKTCEVLAWCPVEDDHNIPEYVETLNYSYCKLILS